MASQAIAESELTLADFDFELPPELIAQHPLADRCASRLLHVTPNALRDLHFADMEQLLGPDDLLVFNDTRVIRARLLGRKPSGGKVEALIERVLEPNAGAGTGPYQPPTRHRCLVHFRRVGPGDGRRAARRLLRAAIRRRCAVGARSSRPCAAAAVHRPRRQSDGCRALPDGLCATPGRGGRADSRTALHAAAARPTACAGTCSRPS